MVIYDVNGNYNINLKQNLCHNTSSYPVAPNYNHNNSLVVDSGASRTYLKTEHEQYLSNVTTLDNGPTAFLPDNTSIQAHKSGDLPLHANLTPEVLVFPDLKSE